MLKNRFRCICARVTYSLARHRSMRLRKRRQRSINAFMNETDSHRREKLDRYYSHGRTETSSAAKESEADLELLDKVLLAKEALYNSVVEYFAAKEAAIQRR